MARFSITALFFTLLVALTTLVAATKGPLVTDKGKI
jgi:hypothetical protein